jgi:murein DD-endopeptidase MepM/ murein hydrolase activator NlpD
MSRVVALLCSRRAPQTAVLALMSIGFAGCSADMQSRFAQGPSGPYAAPEATGSVQAPPPQVEQRELPQYSRPRYQSQYQSSELPPPLSTPQSYPASGGGRREVGSYSHPTNKPIDSTGAVAPRSVAAAREGWNHKGSTTIIVGTSDTMDGLSKRYGVSTAEILKANGYKGPRALQPGQQLVIPPRAAVAAAAPAPKAGMASDASPKPGAKIAAPVAKNAAVAAPIAQPATVAAQPAPAAAPATKTAVVTSEPAQKARLAQATTTPEEAKTESPAKAADATGALPTFRWPVRGRVITSYGAKTNGKSNDGINVAVPEGTPVKAAEDGVVAYSGNELKGYGNLILVRHSNGYVTAYAHASELMVKRGENIKRGQIIAKSGQSGEVGSPQLHFEIRKGSSPVDPLQFLNGA